MAIYTSNTGTGITGTLLNLAWRHAWRRPFQSIFFIIGVALGVAMIVAIDLANGAANRAFALSTEAVAGKATHQIIGGPGGLDEKVYADLRRQLGYRLSAPVVEGYVIAEELDAQPMRLLGVDSFSEPPFRSYLDDRSTGFADANTFSAFLIQPGAVLIGADVAHHYHLNVKDSIHVQVGSRHHVLQIIDLLSSDDEKVRRALDGLLITDIATAQEVLGKVGRLDRIDLIIPEGTAEATTLERITAVLPPGARIETPNARSRTMAEMTAAFRLNLTSLSLLALLVGMFLIYNTVSFSVVQRRPVLGSLRALGMTRREIFTMILIEAGLLGIIGTAMGIGLGILLGRGAVEMVTTSINDLFFVAIVRRVDFPLPILFKGGASGIGAALVAAVLPAYEATSVPPAGALQRSHIEERTHAALPWVSGVGLGTLLLGVVLLLPKWHLSVTFAGVFAIIIGIALLTPVMTLGLMRLLEAAIQRKEGVSPLDAIREMKVPVRMAPRNITRSLSRTSVAIAALMVAVSVIVGVSVMIGSFRLTVERWLTDLLQADIFISPPSLISSRPTTSLEPGVVEKLATFPGIAQIATSRVVDVSAGQFGTIQLVAVSEDIAREKRHYKSAVGDYAATWEALEAGGLFINEPMGNRFGLRVGDGVMLLTDRGERQFPVVAVVYDFDVQSGALIHDPIYRKFWDDPGLSSVALFVESGVDVDAKINELRAAFAGEVELVIRSNQGLRENSLAVFDRTFSITVALQMLATVVAFIGVLSTLMSLQLERRREIGTLRAIGMTRRQLWKLTLLETGLMGSSAGLIAMPTGFILAVILIYIINLRSFGWTLQMQLQIGHFLQAFMVALVAALLAGIYPAWRMGRMQPADALRAE
ncbi:MAG: ABC transporter permease [Candidatus Poribacteria bacterium]|nr:ABC transporter permease [Candidatus Poribacteria bacterium]